MQFFMKRFACILAAGVVIFLAVNQVEICASEKSTKKKLVLTAPEGEGILTLYLRKTFQELGKRTGIEISIQELPKNRALISANDGEFDGVANRVIHLEKAYPNLKRVKVACFTVQHIVYARRVDILETVRDFKTLTDHTIKNAETVGYLRGSKKAKDELSKLPDKNKRALDSPEQAFRMLELDRIDAYLAGPGLVNRAIFKEKFYHSGIQEVGVFAEFPLFPYVHARHASLIPQLEKALQSMVDDGTLDSIRNSLE